MSNLLKILSNFNRQSLSDLDRLFIGLILGSFGLAFTYLSINHFTFDYSGIFYMPLKWLYLAPLIFGVTVLAMYARTSSPGTSYFIRSLGLYFFVFMALATLTSGLQYTPFPLIDHKLVAIDQWLGFSSTGLLNWTSAHPQLKHILMDFYGTIGFQLVLVPFVLLCLQDRKGMNSYLLTIMLSYLIGTTIYYFLPTAGPTAVFQDIHFMQSQHDTFIKYFQIHHYLAVSTSDGGMIAFPSFHVIWAILLAYACRNRWWLWVPVATVNTIVILSTLFLAWHYLTDVLASIVICAVVILLSQRILQHTPAEPVLR